MTTPRDPELILAAWLDEHAIPLPETTRRAIDVAIRTTPQQRQSGWLPRRPEPMINMLRLGVVAVTVAVVALGSITFLQQSTPPIVGVSPAPSVSSSPAPDTSTWETFTSERYGFEVQYPSDWDVYPATSPYRLGEDNDFQVEYDRITVGAAFSGLYVMSVPREAGAAPEQWLEQNLCPCLTDVSEWESRTIDGQPALQAVTNYGEQTIDVIVFTDDRVYQFVGANLLVRDQAIWEAFLSTVRLHPEDAVDTP
jgi:hypothetical protein